MRPLTHSSAPTAWIFLRLGRVANSPGVCRVDGHERSEHCSMRDGRESAGRGPPSPTLNIVPESADQVEAGHRPRIPLVSPHVVAMQDVHPRESLS